MIFYDEKLDYLWKITLFSHIKSFKRNALWSIISYLVHIVYVAFKTRRVSGWGVSAEQTKCFSEKGRGLIRWENPSLSYMWKLKNLKLTQS